MASRFLSHLGLVQHYVYSVCGADSFQHVMGEVRNVVLTWRYSAEEDVGPLLLCQSSQRARLVETNDEHEPERSNLCSASAF